MALCSQAFTAKRSCSFDNGSNKKICLRRKVCYSSSDDGDSDDEQSYYMANQIKAKRRASSRVSFSLNSCSNSELSKAVSKYSDDDGYDSNNNDDNIDCKLTSSPSSSTNLNATLNNQRNHIQISDSSSQMRRSIPESDKQSRSRCFEYLVGSIDEAWARYCDATSYVEDEVYGYNTPASVATDDEDYFGNTTDITDYESDYEYRSGKPSNVAPRQSLAASPRAASANSIKDPSCQLQALKDRLTKAKYFLQDLVDSDDYNDAVAFWKRWDMIKYATIELVEDDDDDEVIESSIDELEDGRLFAN